MLLDQLVRSPIGETLTAIREDEVSAASLGINCHEMEGVRLRASVRRSPAPAGCFYASFVGTLVPDAFFITESFTILAMVIVGGMGTLIGPVFGAILLTVLPELLRGIGDLRLIVYGVAVTLVVLFMPGGMVAGGRAWSRAAAAATTASDAADCRIAKHRQPMRILFRAEGLQQKLRRRAGRARHFVRTFPPARCSRSSGRTAPANRRCSIS